MFSLPKESDLRDKYCQEIKKWQCTICNAEFNSIDEFYEHLDFIEKDRDDFKEFYQELPKNIGIGSVIRVKIRLDKNSNQYFIAKIIKIEYDQLTHLIKFILDRGDWGFYENRSSKFCYYYEILKNKELITSHENFEPYRRFNNFKLKKDLEILTEDMVVDY